MLDAKLATAALNALTEFAKVFNSQKKPNQNSVGVDFSRFEECLANDQGQTAGWAETVQIRDMASPRDVDQFYIKLNLARGEYNSSSGTYENPARLLSSEESCVVLGPPGAGKTTMLKALCRGIYTQEPSSEDERCQYPLLVQFRNLRRGERIAEHLLDRLGIEVSSNNENGLPRSEVHRQSIQHAENALICLIRETNAVLLLDGWDELHLQEAPQACEELSRIIRGIRPSIAIMTCRHGAYEHVIEGVKLYSVQPFSPEDVNEFSAKWFGEIVKANQFLGCLRKKPYKTLVQTPLHAANLCLIYQNDGDLPQEHSRIYEKIINVRIREWDRERGIGRGSRYQSFGPDEKRRFLAQSAFELSRVGNGVQFDLLTFRQVFLDIKKTFALATDDADSVLKEIESHTGLIQKTDFDRFQFYHKTLYEYLCGEYLSRMPILPDRFDTIINMPDACALATILSANPDSMMYCIWERLIHPRCGAFGLSDAVALESFWARMLYRMREEKARFAGDFILVYGLVRGLTDSFPVYNPRLFSTATPRYVLSPGGNRASASRVARSKRRQKHELLADAAERGILSSFFELSGVRSSARRFAEAYPRPAKMGGDSKSDSFPLELSRSSAFQMSIAGGILVPERLTVPTILARMIFSLAETSSSN